MGKQTGEVSRGGIGIFQSKKAKNLGDVRSLAAVGKQEGRWRDGREEVHKLGHKDRPG